MKKFTTILLSLFLVTTIAGCGNPAGTGSNTTNGGTNSGSSGNGSSGTYFGRTFTIPQITLPESVGENPFAGHTFTETYSNCTMSFSNSTVTWSFGPNTFKTYNYAYNANNSLLYLSCTSITQPGTTGAETVSSLADWANTIESYYGSYPTERKSYLLDVFLKHYFSKSIYTYSISGNILQLSSYFDGTLPVETAYFTNTSPNISLRNYNLTLGSGPGIPCCDSCNFNNGTISGKLFISQSSSNLTELEGEILGDFEATYTTSGTGTSGCSVTITFTSLPASVQGFATNTPYTLTQQ